MSMTEKDIDAANLLEAMLGPCDDDPEHKWSECHRCLTINELEQRAPLSVKLFQHAIARLRAAPSPAMEIEGLERDRQWLMGAADALLCDISEQVGRSFDHATKRDDGECALCSKVADSLGWLLRGTVAAIPQQDKEDA